MRNALIKQVPPPPQSPATNCKVQREDTWGAVCRHELAAWARIPVHHDRRDARGKPLTPRLWIKQAHPCRGFVRIALMHGKCLLCIKTSVNFYNRETMGAQSQLSIPHKSKSRVYPELKRWKTYPISLRHCLLLFPVQCFQVTNCCLYWSSIYHHCQKPEVHTIWFPMLPILHEAQRGEAVSLPLPSDNLLELTSGLRI